MLATPASETPSERLFSAAGNVANDKRISLTTSNIDALLFIGQDYKALQRCVEVERTLPAVKQEQVEQDADEMCEESDDSEAPDLPEL